jgi:hypothetical protein
MATVPPINVPLVIDVRPLNDVADELLTKVAVAFVDSDTLPAAFLALTVALEHGDELGARRARREIRAILGMDHLRLCSTCQKVHRPDTCEAQS